MNCELAKELKEAGFPQNKEPFGRHAYTRDGVKVYAYPEHFNENSEMPIIPTLEELIEACGKEFEALVQYDDFTWRAYRKDGSDDLQDVTSFTPIEAVAELWLALNKKSA